jgi:WD40 repeat protein
MAPEQAMEGGVDIRADIYSLGTTLYTLLAGRPPFSGSAGQKLLAHQMKAPPPLDGYREDVPPGLATVINKMMAKNREDRYQTPAEVVTALQPFAAPPAPPTVPNRVAVAPVKSPAPISAPAPSKLAPRKPAWQFDWRLDRRPDRLRIAMTAAAAVLVLGSVWWAFGRSKPKPVVEVIPETPEMAAFAMTLNGHSDGVQDIAFSADGSQIISYGRDKTIRAWNLATAQEIWSVETNARGVKSVAVSPDGKQALTGDDAGPARLWDLASGKLLQTLTGARSAWTVTFLDGGTRALTAGTDGTVRFWDLKTGEETRRLDVWRGSVWSAAVSPDGKRVAVGVSAVRDDPAPDYSVRVWDVELGKEVLVCTGHTADVRRVTWAPDGKRIVSGGFDGTVRIWDSTTGLEQSHIDACPHYIEGVCVLPDGKRLLTTDDREFAVKLWDIGTGQELTSWAGHSKKVTQLILSPDGKRAASCGDDRSIIVWNVPQ